jgi:hypothetical protein
MSVITVDFGTRQRGPAPLLRTQLPELPVIEWWTHPRWCDPQLCYGGHYYSDHHYSSARTHTASTLNATFRDAGSTDVSVSVQATVGEDVGEGYDTTFVELELAGTEITVSADDAEEYAHAILAAVALARQALPALSPRPSSEGGGRATNLPDAS